MPDCARVGGAGGGEAGGGGEEAQCIAALLTADDEQREREAFAARWPNPRKDARLCHAIEAAYRAAVAQG